MIYEIKNLNSARIFLKQSKNRVVLSNPEGSTRYYGMRVIDYIFKTLQQEFPEKIESIIVNTYDDYPAFITARKLGYNNIKHISAA